MLTLLTVLQQEQGDGGSALGGILGLIIAVVAIASLWIIFGKAGRPGWFSIIPILNTVTLIQVAGKPWWWFLLLFIPIVNFVILVLVMLSLAKAFGKSTLFAIGLILLSPIFLAILAFSDAQYQLPRPA